MDTDLVVRAQGGDREAFTGLVDAIGGRLQSVADNILRDAQLAEDATQAALIGIWRDLPHLREPGRFEAWAYRLLVRACYAEARRSRRWLPNLPAGELSTPDDLGGVIDRDQLERAFRRLSVDQRAVVVLHHYLDLPRTEVAEALGVPLGTVHSRLRLAMQALRAALEADARQPAQTSAREVVG